MYDKLSRLAKILSLLCFDLDLLNNQAKDKEFEERKKEYRGSDAFIQIPLICDVASLD